MTGPQIAIVGYGLGNVRSIKNALDPMDCQAQITNTHEAIKNADAVILPGVGAFPASMEHLNRSGLSEQLREFCATGKPFLGICVGLQVLFEIGLEFGRTEGLGLIAGEVGQLPLTSSRELRLPHIGWKKIKEPVSGRWNDTILRGADDSYFYFVHSFAARPNDVNDVLAIGNFGAEQFVAAVQKKNIAGLQFHPERSGPEGLAVLKNFVEMI